MEGSNEGESDGYWLGFMETLGSPVGFGVGLSDIDGDRLGSSLVVGCVEGIWEVDGTWDMLGEMLGAIVSTGFTTLTLFWSGTKLRQ